MDAPPQLTNGHSAAATMQQPPSASSAGPQIRSRITVVCAECKRLKLKCDRRTPCGSCTKRDTVARCTYSPAAAEKVDLHSLNNRLIQVEHAMALITAGQNLPAFQSSYPLAFPTGTSNAQPPVFSSAFVSNSPGSHQHQHHHHYAVPSAHISAHNSFSPSTSDLSSIWLQDLDLSIPSATGSSSTQRPRSFSNAENAGLIKLEPSPIDIELSQPQTNTSVGDDLGQPSRAPSPLKRMRNERHQQQQQRSSAQLLLPALSIYYPLPSIPPPGTSASSSSSAPFPLHPSSASPSSTPPSTSPPSSSVNNGYSSSSHLPAPCTKPQVTQALLALLPLLPACSRLLHNARDVLRIRPIPFESAPGQGWKQFENRCLTLLGGGANKERDKEREKKEREREKAREARRARQIYFGGIPGLQPHVTLDTEMDDVAAAGGRNTAKSNGESEDGTGDDHSLTFFAVMCGVLAIGASIPSSSAPLTTTTDAIKENPAFLYALSQQALGVWDTHTSSTSSGSALTAAEETEKLDYLLACIAGLSYLLFSNSPARVVGAGDAEREGTGGLGLIYPLVGKLVNAARGMGLAKDSSVLTSVLSRKGKHASDGAATSERPGAPAAHGPGGGAPGKVVSKREREAERERIREEWKKMIWWEVLYYDLFTADALGHQSYIPAYLFGMKLPGCSSPAVPSHFDQQDSDDSGGGFDGLGIEQEDLCSKARTRPSRNLSAIGGDDSEHEEDYFGARYRLTQLAQRIKTRLTHPDCCCGYTLDQAAQLEAEVRQWQATLPVALRWTELPAMIPDAAVPLVHERHGPNADKVVHLQSCELAVMGNLLLVKVYTPFLRHIANTGASAGASSGLVPSGLDRNSTSAPDAASISTSAAQTTLHASQLIIRAVKDAYATQRAISIFSSPSSSFSPSASPGKTNSWPIAVSPAMFDLYSVDKIVFHAAVVCAHAGLADKAPPPLAMDVDAVLEDATVGLGALLMEQGAPSVGPLGHAQRKVADVLYKRTQFRVNSASHGMKRKHSQANLSNVSNAFGLWLPNGQSTNIISLPGPEHDWMDSYQNQVNAVDMHASSQSQAPCPPNFTRDRPKPDLQSAVRQAVAVRDLARVDDEKDKKYAKKTSYPSVGFRVRPGKDGQTRARGLSSAAQQPLMTSTPRPLRSADTVLAYQQQQKQKLQAIADGPPANGGPASSSSYEEDLNRSRSSSFSHVQPNPSQQHQQQPSQHSDSAAEDLQYPFFGGATPSEMLNMQQMLPRKRYSIHEQTQPPQPLSPEHPPFTPHIFDQSHSQAMYEQAYDGSSGTAVEGIGYSTVSSPFSNGAPTSSSGSPFTTTSVVSGGHPPTPTFGPHAPVFGPQPLDDLPTSSPTTYFHTPNVFNDSAYPGPSTSSAHLSHQQQQHNMALGLNMEMSISSAPGYEKAAHQNAMYDIKSSIEQHQIAHQQRQMPAMEGYDDQGHQLGMGMPAAASWTAEQQRQQPQQPHQQSPSNAFWSNGPEYRFYP